MTTYTKIEVPEGPITIQWLDDMGMKRKKGGWVVRMPGAEGFTYFSSPSGRESGTGLRSLREAVLLAMRFSEYHNRAIVIEADRELVELVMGDDLCKLNRFSWSVVTGR